MKTPAPRASHEEDKLPPPSICLRSRSALRPRPAPPEEDMEDVELEEEPETRAMQPLRPTRSGSAAPSAGSTGSRQVQGTGTGGPGGPGVPFGAAVEAASSGQHRQQIVINITGGSGQLTQSGTDNLRQC
eukprot:s1349_g22.t1